jgi:hypothetical protein
MLLLSQGGLATVRRGLRGSGVCSAARPLVHAARRTPVATLATGSGGGDKSWGEIASDVAGVAK